MSEQTGRRMRSGWAQNLRVSLLAAVRPSGGGCTQQMIGSLQDTRKYTPRTPKVKLIRLYVRGGKMLSLILLGMRLCGGFLAVNHIAKEDGQLFQAFCST